MITAKVVQSRKASKGMKELLKGVNKLEKNAVEIGYFDGKQHEGSGMSLATLMTLLEYGSNDGKIPARFAFTQISQTDSPKRNKALKSILKKGIAQSLRTGNSDVLLEVLGKKYMKSIRSIFGDTSRLISNAKLTQKLKGRDEPLVDTGELLSELTYRKIKN